MKMRKLLITILFVTISFTLHVLSQDCGKKTNETPRPSSTTNTLNAGTHKSINGIVYLPDGEVADDIIVELYFVPESISLKNLNSQIDETIKQKRLRAQYIKKHGKFCFNNIKDGNYLLRINPRDQRRSISFELSQEYILVKVDSKNKNSKKQIIEVSFSIAI